MTNDAATDTELAEFEQQFGARFPNYRSMLDEDRLAREMGPRLDALTRQEEPFPHIWTESFLPEWFFALLDAAWPPLLAHQTDKNRQKLNLVPRIDPGYEMTGQYASLPVQIRDVWTFFIEVVNRRIVGPWLKRAFAPEIAERVTTLQRLAAEGRVGFSVSGLETGRLEANHGRMMVRGEGYVLQPHVDPAPYVVTVLHYFADRRDDGYGTRLYRAASPVPMEEFVRRGSTTYFAKLGIAVEEAACLPFVNNGFLAFPNLLNAAHGVVAPVAGYRRVYQYHLSLKGDHESV